MKSIQTQLNFRAPLVVDGSLFWGKSLLKYAEIEKK